MSVKYGATDVNEKIPEIVTEDKPVDTDSLRKVASGEKRPWCTVTQNSFYGLGHVFNDLCAAMWFSYMMLFLQAVLNMKAAVAGAMLLVGQVIDALATPIVGLLANKYGTLMGWHLAGCVMVVCSFPLLFVRCWGCWPGSGLNYLVAWMPIYYAVLITIFQIGWAVVQISHLAMIPIISDDIKVRSELTSIRYMASVLASLTVYLVTWIVLKTDYSAFIGPTDDYKFRNIAIIITLMGLLSFVAFHLTFHLHDSKGRKKSAEPQPANGVSTNSEGDMRKLSATGIEYFLRNPLLYQTSLLYVFSRLFWALSLVYVPLFLEERLAVSTDSSSELVASVPLVLYISSFFCTLLFKSKLIQIGNSASYLIGSFISLLSCFWIAVIIDPKSSTLQIYTVAVLMGVGNSITLVASLTGTADLIGINSQLGGAIYAIVTFADKLITGIVVVVIEYFKCDNRAFCPKYYEEVLTYVCGACALLGALSLTIQPLNKLLKMKFKRKPEPPPATGHM